ncbi:hypothetical protein [Chamaesiphon minutus]|uniref:hypothetical protein n=1 Tax=Chamaesiphon minutus TaxID=1173032 RepID=UPI000305CF1D|nr:hypothetical protein [Chamaesiphon minutus]
MTSRQLPDFSGDLGIWRSQDRLPIRAIDIKFQVRASGIIVLLHGDYGQLTEAISM